MRSISKLIILLLGMLLILSSCTKMIEKPSMIEIRENDLDRQADLYINDQESPQPKSGDGYSVEQLERLIVDDLPNTEKMTLKVKIGDNYDYQDFDFEMMSYEGIDYIRTDDAYRLLEKVNSVYKLYDLSSGQNKLFDVNREEITVPIKQLESLEEVVFEYKLDSAGFILSETSQVPDYQSFTTHLKSFNIGYISDGEQVYLPIMVMNYAFFGRTLVMYYDRDYYYLELADNGYSAMENSEDNLQEPSLSMRRFTVGYLMETLRQYYPYYVMRKSTLEGLYTYLKNDMIDEHYDDYIESLNRLVDELGDGHTGVLDVKVMDNAYEDGYVKDFFSSVTDEYYENMFREKPRKFGSSYKRTLEGNIGYIYYADFSDNSFADSLERTISQLKNTKGIILDLRYNEGGYIQNIFKLLEPFASDTVIIPMKQRLYGKSTPVTEFVLEKVDQETMNKPVILLVNEYTYSAANMFAGIFQVNDLGKIMGQTSGGGGSYRSTCVLPDLTTLSISAYDYILIGENNQLNEFGVVPDIWVEDNFGNGKDQVLDQAVEEMKQLIEGVE